MTTDMSRISVAPVSGPDSLYDSLPQAKRVVMSANVRIHVAAFLSGVDVSIGGDSF